MSVKWIKIPNIKGIRYYEHSFRLYKKRKDRNFVLQYKLGGKVKNETLGWESDGWTIEKAVSRLQELKQNQRTGDGPKTLSEKREISEQLAIEKETLKFKEQAKGTLFQEVFDKYIERVKLDESAGSYIRKAGLFKKWISPSLGNLRLVDIKPSDIENIKDHMFNNGQSVRSIDYALTVITRTFKHAEILELFDGLIPTSKVKVKKKDNKRVKFLTTEEANLLLTELEQSSFDTHDIALFSLYCGLRLGEILNLEWQDVNFDTGRIFVRGRKNKENSALPMHPKVREMLLNRKQSDFTGYIFKTKDGHKVKSLSNTYERTVEKLGLNNAVTDRLHKVVFHTLRHTYASWLVMNGVDLYTVQRLMGHKDISMTQRYSHLAPEHLDKAVGTLI